MKDLVDVPKRARSELKILPVEHMDQVLEIALAPAPPKAKPVRPRRNSVAREKTEDKGKDVPGEIRQRQPAEKTPIQPGA
jgi:ATP-dependent Lon protease